MGGSLQPHGLDEDGASSIVVIFYTSLEAFNLP